uniref:GATA-type domain-containing protein n=1 Tax=Nelumbo nucifera TaxID=4432 RepID=A0A822ZBI3_NELNU|nr:TPA_asm: hypothetical protein HUJ06_014729 [Nelumbo nucifera]
MEDSQKERQSTPCWWAIANRKQKRNSSQQGKSGMECVEARALKTSLWPEMGLKPSQQVSCDDDCFVNGSNGLAGDDFFVDGFFDFSNGDLEEGIFEGQLEEKDYASVSSQEQAENDNSNSSAFSEKDDFGSVPGSELSVPADDLANLEWLSHFVEDSFSEFSQPYPAGNPTVKPQGESLNRYETEPGTTTVKVPVFLTPIPGKARSKRARTGGRVWSLASPRLPESSSTSSSSCSSTSSSSTSCFTFLNSGHNLERLCYTGGNPPAKKQKKPGTETGGAQPPRRCSHCHVQKTPQWRTGPLGAKTLCNACGVRYKSGRLLPEYRPACSPTFSNDVHSNNHRKVLEMRRKKEMMMMMMSEPESGLAPAVQSF